MWAIWNTGSYRILPQLIHCLISERKTARVLLGGKHKDMQCKIKGDNASGEEIQTKRVHTNDWMKRKKSAAAIAHENGGHLRTECLNNSPLPKNCFSSLGVINFVMTRDCMSPWRETGAHSPNETPVCLWHSKLWHIVLLTMSQAFNKLEWLHSSTLACLPLTYNPRGISEEHNMKCHISIGAGGHQQKRLIKIWT